MSMSDVRSSLWEIRSSWDAQTPWEPFNPSRMMEKNQMSLTRFTWLFVLGHHTNRKRYSEGGGKGGGDGAAKKI